MPVYDAPNTLALFEDSRAEPAAVNVSSLAVVHHVRGNCVFESRPGGVASEMNLYVAEFVFCVLHLTHLGNKMMVAIVGPAIISVAALEDRQRLVISPNFRGLGDIVSCKAQRASEQCVTHRRLVIRISSRH